MRPLNVLFLVSAHNSLSQRSWIREVVETDSHLVVSALAGDAVAGGVPFALAGDRVVAREDVVLNPYYRHMGGLYGSEYRWFFGEDRSYHAARHRFVHKLGAPCAVPTPAVETRPATIRRARAR
jgi:hypothetical protein